MNIPNMIKQHRYETICAVLALLILLALWPASRLGSQARAKTKDLENWKRRASTVQRAGPHGLPTDLLVEARQQYVQQMAKEVDQVAQLFRQISQRTFLVEPMFPEPAADAPLRFRTRYNEAIDKLLSNTLRAGWPEDREPDADAKTSPAICVYTQRDDLSVGEWASKADVPDDEDCWFAQLGLWIQEDLAEVFKDLNDASARQREQKPSVENAVVKRIISINIFPYYYVGLDKKTGPSIMPGIPPTVPSGIPTGPAGQMPPAAYRMDFMLIPGAGWPPTTTQPTKKTRTRRTLKDLSDPFTQRTCNDKADVLHFSFSVVVDSRRINELLDALSRKNLYTVLNVSLSREDVKIDTRNFPSRPDRFYVAFDPYADAGRGLVYGTDPIIRLDVDVEALFLRDIYAEYMPKEVKDLLSADTDSARQQRLNKQREYERAQKAAKAAKQKAAKAARQKAAAAKDKPRSSRTSRTRSR